MNEFASGSARELIDAWQAPLYGYACRWLRDATEAEDATQEIFIAVLRDRRQLRSEAAFKAWIYRVAGRVLLRYKRRRRPQAGAEALAAMTASPQRALENAERRAILEASVATLPEPIRQALILKYDQGLTQVEGEERSGYVIAMPGR